ncbi:hypothetical protein SAMN05421853_11238 [Roseivivax halotolerans]|jgi:hypothetical protein|uniref:Uncharacterized protein n=1 Tax=Roseivivax halotolerans TaxID=93684 RepID=A0A1I5ZTE9_9RHOB|nr:hypothetical protein FIU91_04305 [Roseivivax sp. THAF30]SFQ59715.1 hypothetical protein SAMN05421853_11238 [Roseivivax halotolerans]
MTELDPLRYVLACCFGTSPNGPLARLFGRKTPSLFD